MIRYRMGLVDAMFANSFSLSWWVDMYHHLVDRFVAVAGAWTALDRASSGDGKEGL